MISKKQMKQLLDIKETTESLICELSHTNEIEDQLLLDKGTNMGKLVRADIVLEELRDALAQYSGDNEMLYQQMKQAIQSMPDEGRLNYMVSKFGDITPEDAGIAIKKRRKAAGLTQKQLAKAVGKAEISIRQYERGRRKPSLATWIDINKALGFVGSAEEGR